MMYKLVNKDGTIAIMTIVKGDIYSELAKQDVSIKDFTLVEKITVEDLPLDREHRDAWTNVTAGTKVDIDLDKVKSKQLSILRDKRNKKLEEMDRKSLVAIEEGQDLTEIKKEKERLRNLTDQLKAVDTVGKVNDMATIEILNKLGAIKI